MNKRNKQQVRLQVLRENTELRKKVTSTLVELFPKTDKEPEYSIGYQRWSKLSFKKQKVIFLKFKCDQKAAMDALQTSTYKELIT